MAQVTVRESGGDYNDLRSAVTAGETDILIAGLWTASDEGPAVQVKSATLIRYDAEAKDTYVLDSGGTDVIHLYAGSVGSDIEIPEIRVSSVGGHRGIRWFEQTAGARIANTKFTAANVIANQHPLVCVFCTSSGVIENCWASGFGEGFFRIINGDANTANFDIISCTSQGNGADATNAFGGIHLDGTNADTIINLRMFSCSITGQVNGDDFTITGTPNNITTTLESCIDSDGSIAAFDPTATDCISNVTPTDAADPGAGSYIVFEDITNAPFNLRLKSHANNVAQDAHDKSTGAGLTMPANDYDGTTRPQNTLYDIGAFEIVAAEPPAQEAEITFLDATASTFALEAEQTVGQTASIQFLDATASTFALEAEQTVGQTASIQFLDATASTFALEAEQIVGQLASIEFLDATASTFALEAIQGGVIVTLVDVVGLRRQSSIVASNVPGAVIAIRH